MAAVLISEANAEIVVPASVTVEALITIVLPLLNVGFATVPIIAGWLADQLVDPTSTHVPAAIPAPVLPFDLK